MGYQVYDIGNNRFGGYGVSTICEHPGCNKEIDRGMSYACGGEPFSEYGCDRYFCEEHTKIKTIDNNGETITDEKYKIEDEDNYEFKEVCERCAKGKDPFPYKPESKEWLEHIINDESWKIWREKNPKILKIYKSQIAKAI